MSMGVHNHSIIANHYYMELPYYKPVPRHIKTAINKHFLEGIRRKFKTTIAYMHSLEQQNGLLHVNYYLLSDQPLDIEWCVQRWGEALLLKAGINFKAAECDISEVINEESVTRYILKCSDDNPEEYLPERGRYRKIMYTSRNWHQFIEDRSEDSLLEEMYNNCYLANYIDAEDLMTDVYIQVDEC